MSILSYLGPLGLAAKNLPLYGIQIGAWSGWDVYNSDIQVTVGGSYTDNYGTVANNVFGSRRDVTFCDGLKSFAGIAGSYYSERGSGELFLKGLSGNSNFCYGPRAEFTYGGPCTTIVRGPSLAKASVNPLPAFKQTYVGLERFSELPSGIEALQKWENDKETAQTIAKLSTLLYFLVCAHDVSLFLAYTKAKEFSQVARIAVSALTATCKQAQAMTQGIIFGIEKAEGWKDYWIDVKADFSSKKFYKDDLKAKYWGLPAAVVVLSTVTTWLVSAVRSS